MRGQNVHDEDMLAALISRAGERRAPLTQLEAIWRRQLRAPLLLHPADINGAPRMSEGCLETVGDLLRHPKPPLEFLQWIKECPTKQVAEQDQAVLPPEIPAALYYLVIALGVARCNRRITDLEDATLRKGLAWAVQQKWLDSQTLKILEDAAKLLAEVVLPGMPKIGHPEGYYARMVLLADKAGNQHEHEAAKVGQYITLALSPGLAWGKKLRFFEHALRRHCEPPRLASEEIWMFYAQLADLVRQYAGLEALRLASKQDDLYAKRLEMGQRREKIVIEAEDFFEEIMGTANHRPPHFNQEDWDQLKLIRNQWL